MPGGIDPDKLFEDISRIERFPSDINDKGINPLSEFLERSRTERLNN
jgi:hypothetical protein